MQILGLMRERSHTIGAVLPAQSDLRRHAAFANSVYTASFRGPLDVRSVAAIIRAVHDFHPDILFATTPDEWVWSCLIPRRITGAGLVLVRHMSLRLAPAVRWLANRRADAVVAVSAAVRSALMGRFGVAPDRIHVIHNPVRFPIRDCVPSPMERYELRQSLGLGTDGRWLGFFGGNDPLKGIEDVMEAARMIRSRGIDLRLLVCGRARRKDSITELAARHQLSGFVHDGANPDEIEDALGAVDAVAMATNKSLGEGLPLIALEAMARGTPVAGYATAGIIDALGEHEEGGLLAEPGNPTSLARALEAILADADLADRIARRGLERARSLFDPALAADRYERLFLEIAERSRTAHRSKS